MRRLTPVAIAYDFDGTLSPGNMQEHSFIPDIGMTAKEFWKMAEQLAQRKNSGKVRAEQGRGRSYYSLQDLLTAIKE